LANVDAPIEYEPGTWGPAEADQLIEHSAGWHTPHAEVPNSANSASDVNSANAAE
jgi:hypothetical protein